MDLKNGQQTNKQYFEIQLRGSVTWTFPTNIYRELHLSIPAIEYSDVVLMNGHQSLLKSQ